jgi:hypothetical protein
MNFLRLRQQKDAADEKMLHTVLIEKINQADRFPCSLSSFSVPAASPISESS